MTSKVLPASIALCALLIAAHAAAENWVEVRNENGILVEKLDDPSRVLPILRAKTTVAGKPEAVLAWVRDSSSYPRWMADCEEARQIKSDGEVSYAYNRVGAPWPVSDRDSVVRAVYEDRGDGSHRVDFENTADVSVPVPEDVVRMTKIVGHWDLRPDGSGGTALEYQIDSDPGGSLPGWLVARVANENPFTTVGNLKALVESGATK